MLAWRKPAAAVPGAAGPRITLRASGMTAVVWAAILWDVIRSKAGIQGAGPATQRTVQRWREPPVLRTWTPDRENASGVTAARAVRHSLRRHSGERPLLSGIFS